MSLMQQFETWGRLVPLAGHEDRFVGQLGEEGQDGTLVVRLRNDNVVIASAHISESGEKLPYETLHVTRTEGRTRSTLGVGTRPVVHVFVKKAMNPSTGEEFLAVWTQQAQGARVSQAAYDAAMDL
jgi:hypothetical protein